MKSHHEGLQLRVEYRCQGHFASSRNKSTVRTLSNFLGQSSLKCTYFSSIGTTYAGLTYKIFHCMKIESIPNLRQATVKDHERDFLCLLDQPIDVRQKLLRGAVHATLDIPAHVVIISDIDNQKVFLGHPIALHQICQFLQESSISATRTSVMNIKYHTSPVI